MAHDNDEDVGSVEERALSGGRESSRDNSRKRPIKDRKSRGASRLGGHQNSSMEKTQDDKEALLKRLKEKLAELQKAIGSGNKEEINKLRRELLSLVTEGLDVGIYVQDLLNVLKEADAVTEGLTDKRVAEFIERDIKWFKHFDETANKLSKEIDFFITPEVAEQLSEYTGRLDRGGDLTEEEARKFVDTHLSPPRFDEHVRLVQENSKLIDEHFERRNTLIKMHGESHEAVRNFDERTRETVKQLASNNQKVKKHTGAVRDISKRSAAVREEVQKKSQKYFERNISVIDSLAEQLESNEKKLTAVVKKEPQKEAYLASKIVSRLVKEIGLEETAPVSSKIEEIRMETKLEIKKDLISKAKKIGEVVRGASEQEPITTKKSKKKFVNRFEKAQKDKVSSPQR